MIKKEDKMVLRSFCKKHGDSSGSACPECYEELMEILCELVDPDLMTEGEWTSIVVRVSDVYKARTLIANEGEE